MIGIQEIDAAELRKVLKVLNALEPDTTKTLRAELKSKLSPVAEQVASAVPRIAPLSGFANNGRTRWDQVKGKVSFTPGKSRQNATNLIAIRVDIPASGGAGPMIAELAGSRSSGKTRSGQVMIEKLNERKQMKGRGGRYAYAQFRLLRVDIIRIATDIVNGTFKKFEGMLD